MPALAIASTNKQRRRTAQESAEVLTDLVTPLRGEGWAVTTDETWCRAVPPHAPVPVQGWKLHVSATVVTAAEVLRRCVPLLLTARSGFKAARDLRVVEMLTGPHCPRGNAGKVITVYPRDAGHAVELAELLDAATTDLEGPRILSDRPFRPGSLVHYRYGAIVGTPYMDHDGIWTAALRAPDGTVVPDRREASFTPPPWVQNPFRNEDDVSGGALRAAPPVAPGPVLLGGRYDVREAIRHAYRGGVFRAVDRVSGAAVVVKQARAHVGVDRHGRDARDRLRHEADVLGRLQVTGWVPRVHELFEEGSDLFLAEEDLGGQTLRAWVMAGTVAGVVSRPRAQTRDLLVQIARLVADLHRSDVVLRDLSPNNLLVTPERRLALVDPELAVLPGRGGDVPTGIGTPAYAPPEQLAGAPADEAMDLYALGALLVFCCTGEDPLLNPLGTSRIGPSMADWLDVGVRRAACSPEIADLAIRLCDRDPQRRPTAAEVVELVVLTRGAEPLPTAREAIHAALEAPQPMERSTLDDAVAALTRRLITDVRATGSRVAAASSFGSTTLPANVQHGAAGVLGVLLQAHRALGDPELLERGAAVAEWLDAWMTRTPPQGPVGLHFGHAGSCWALADAGRATGDGAMVDRAVSRALQLDARWPSPDVTHGIAGLGLTLVHLWQLTGEPRLRAAVAGVSDELLHRAAHDQAGVSWSTPRDVPSSFAGQRFHGFAHGTAGVGTFLLCAAGVTGSERAMAVAVEAARSLIGAAVRQHGCAWWGSSPDRVVGLLPHWCNGSSGVLTFLARVAVAAPDLDMGNLLEESARAVVAGRWSCGTAYCHGLAGNADALLDLGARNGGAWKDWASDLARVMWERRTVDERGAVLGDEPGGRTPDFGVGYGGGLSTLLRLRSGGPRLWLPEVAS